MKRLYVPISDHEILDLKLGEQVLLSGKILTGRDAAHQWLMETFIQPQRQPEKDEQNAYQAVCEVLEHGVLYHCGPVVSGLESGEYRFISAGPTTSIREEPYEKAVISHFNIKGIIGKGGMGQQTLAACQAGPAVYFHAVGGAGSLIAESVKRVLDVYQLKLGVPEAMWLIEVEDFPVVVTMDAHGGSLHREIAQRAELSLKKLLNL